MKVVIDIPDVIMETKQYVDYFGCVSEKLIKIIESGTPLQKGHGDLYDCNDLSKLVNEDFRHFLSRLDLKSPQPIIEADKAKSEE